MICPVCNLREIPVHTGKGRPSLICKHPECLKKRQAKFFNNYIAGHGRDKEEIEFSGDPNMEYAIYAG
jgi:hypothetical protein